MRDIKLGRADISIPVAHFDANSKARSSLGSESNSGSRDGQVVFYDRDATLATPRNARPSEAFGQNEVGRSVNSGSDRISRSFSDELDHFNAQLGSTSVASSINKYEPRLNAASKQLDLRNFFEDQKLESNADRKRVHKEATSTKYSAGGSNKKNMKDQLINPNIKVDDKVGHSSNEPESPPCRLVDPIEPLPTSESDLVEQRWGVYAPANQSLLKKIYSGLYADAQELVRTTVFEPVLNQAPAVFTAVAGGAIIAKATQRLEPVLGKWGSRALGLVATGALSAAFWINGNANAPDLSGAGSPVELDPTARTNHSHVDNLQYNSWQTGKVYRKMSDELIKHFVGCKVDEHVIRRAMKKASELQSLYSTPIDRGYIADTVSFSLCVVSVEMSRASVSTRVYSGTPSTLAWN